MEIVLLIAGGIIFILSFLIPSKEEKSQVQAVPMAQEEIKELVGHEMDAVKEHVDDVVDEAVSYAMEKTERSLERLSNEKIMAINEYSDTVLGEIHRNHEEAMFLYDMLNSKHVNLKNTVSEVNRTVKEAEETVNHFQRLAPETVNNLQQMAPEPENHFQRLAPETVNNLQRLAPEIVNNLLRQAPETVETPKPAFIRAAEEQMARVVPEISPSTEREDADKSWESRGDLSNSNERILELYSQGKDMVQIARELGLGVGEVKLVIDLFDSQWDADVKLS